MKFLSTVLYGAVTSLVNVFGANRVTQGKRPVFLTRKEHGVVVIDSHVLRLHNLNPARIVDRMTEQEACDAFLDIGCKVRIVRMAQSTHLEKGERILVWCELPDYSSPEYSEWHPWVTSHVLDTFPYLKERVRLVRCDAITPVRALVRLRHEEHYRSDDGVLSVAPFQDINLDSGSVAGTFCGATWHAFLRKDAHWMTEVHEIFHAWQYWMIPPGKPISRWHTTSAGRSFIESGNWRLSSRGEWSNKKGEWLYASSVPPPPFEEMATIATLHFVGPETFSEAYGISLRTVSMVYEQYQSWVKEFLPQSPLLLPLLE